MAGISDPFGAAGIGGRLESEVGYGLPIGRRWVGTPRVGLRRSALGNGIRVGYSVTAREQQALRLRAGIETELRSSRTPHREGAGATSSRRVMGRASLEW